MDDNGFHFEKRTFDDNRNQMNEQEFHKGGGGGGPHFYTSVRTNILSRQCYTDPNNPGKMICKESKNSSAYDPFNQNNNYNNFNEDVYTQDIRGINNEPTFFNKM
jgi:hypothetical protein